jgi:acyl carrier protein
LSAGPEITEPDRELVQQVLRDVRDSIVEVVGEDYLLDLPIDMDTSFESDLQIESIEFVALAERLAERYGDRVDFASWFAEMDLDDVVYLRVGQLVEYIARCLS